MSETTEISTQFGIWEFGDLTIDLDRIPQATIIAAAKRAFVHVLKNEADSKAGTVLDKQIAAGELHADDRDEAKKRLMAEYQAAYLESFYSGTWGTGQRASAGPRLDALETEYQRALAKTVRAWIANKKLPYDKETKTWSWMSAAGKQTRTIEQAVAGYESKMKPEEKAALMAAAQETVDYKKRQAAALKAIPTVAEEEMGI